MIKTQLTLSKALSLLRLLKKSMSADGADIGLRLVPYALAQLRRVEIQYLGIRRHIAVVKDIGDRALDFVARLGALVGVAVSFDDLGGARVFLLAGV